MQVTTLEELTTLRCARTPVLWNAGSKSSGDQQVAQQRLRAVTSSAMTLLGRTEVWVSGCRNRLSMSRLRRLLNNLSQTHLKSSEVEIAAFAWMPCQNRTGPQLGSFRSLRAVTTEPAMATTSQKSWQGRYLSRRQKKESPGSELSLRGSRSGTKELESHGFSHFSLISAHVG